jgi:hypothetical protein
MSRHPHHLENRTGDLNKLLGSRWHSLFSFIADNKLQLGYGADLYLDWGVWVNFGNKIVQELDKLISTVLSKDLKLLLSCLPFSIV